MPPFLNMLIYMRLSEHNDTNLEFLWTALGFQGLFYHTTQNYIAFRIAGTPQRY